MKIPRARPTLRPSGLVGDLAGADRIMNESVFVGVYPGLTETMLGYLIETITRFVKRF